MSLADMKNEVQRLNAEERKELARFLLALREQQEPSAEARPASSFAEAQAYVFDNYGDLLRRLAQ